MATNQAWLDKVSEEILEADLPICDPHHHLWDFRTERVEARYFLDEVLADTGSGHKVASTVFVECGAMYRASGPEPLRPVGETEFVNGMAAMSASGGYGPTQIAKGIVGFANLMLGPAVEEVLVAHMQAGGGRFRGIRHAVAWDPHSALQRARTGPPAHLMQDPQYRAGFACLEPLNLSFEAWMYYHQLPDLLDLAHQFPNTTIILNHLGGPLGIGPYADQKEEIFAQWQRDITDLSRCPNVMVKLGGLHMAHCGYGWHERQVPPTSIELAEATAPWYHHALEHFGAHRCMFESNFPVDKESVSYAVLWNAFKRIAAGCSAEEKAHLFHDTAVSVYRLED